MDSARDWKRPISWGIATFGFTSIAGRIPSVDIKEPIDILLSSTLVAFAFAIVASFIGALRTFAVKSPSRILVPFLSAPRSRSLQAMAIWMVGMVAKVFLYDLGLVGVVVMFVAAFAAVQRLWPDQTKER